MITAVPYTIFSLYPRVRVSQNFPCAVPHHPEVRPISRTPGFWIGFWVYGAPAYLTHLHWADGGLHRVFFVFPVAGTTDQDGNQASHQCVSLIFGRRSGAIGSPSATKKSNIFISFPCPPPTG